jgi:hypothetical protein
MMPERCECFGDAVAIGEKGKWISVSRGVLTIFNSKDFSRKFTQSSESVISGGGRRNGRLASNAERKLWIHMHKFITHGRHGVSYEWPAIRSG